MMSYGCLHDASFLRPAGATSTDQDTSNLIMVCALCDAIAEAKANFAADLRVVRRALIDFLQAFGNALAPLGQAEQRLDRALVVIEDSKVLAVQTAMLDLIENWQNATTPLYQAQQVLDAALSSVFQSLPKFTAEEDAADKARMEKAQEVVQ